MEPPLTTSSSDDARELKKKYDGILTDAKPKWQELYEFLLSRTPRLPPHVLQSLLLTPHELRERYNPMLPQHSGKIIEYQMQVLLRMELLDHLLKKQKERQDPSANGEAFSRKEVDLRISPRKEERRKIAEEKLQREKENEDANIAHLQSDALQLLEYLSIILDPEHCGIVHFMESIVRYYMRPHPTLIKEFYEALELEKPPELGGSPKKKSYSKERKMRPPISPPKISELSPAPSPPPTPPTPKGSLLLRSSSGGIPALAVFHTTTVKRKRPNLPGDSTSTESGTGPQ